MENKVDKRVEIVDKIVRTKKDIKKLNELYEEAAQVGENTGIAIVLKTNIENKEKELENLEEDRKNIGEQLKEKKEMYEERNSKISEELDKINADKEYFANLIEEGEKKGLVKDDENGNYKDAIQANRAKKVEELEKKYETLNNKLEKNNEFIAEIDKTLKLLGIEEETIENEEIKNEETKNEEVKSEEKKDKVENEKKNEEKLTDKEKMVEKGKQILNDISTDYTHTHLNVTEFDRKQKIKVDKDFDNKTNKEKVEEKVEEKDNKESNKQNIEKRKPEQYYIYGEELPDKQVEGLYNNEETKAEVKESMLKRGINKIKSLKIVQSISKFFTNLSNKIKMKVTKVNLISASEQEKTDNDNKKDMKEETKNASFVEKIDNKDGKIEEKAKEKVTAQNVIEVMQKAMEEKEKN